MARKVNLKGAFPQCRQTVIDEPSTAAEIVDLIRAARDGFWSLTPGEAIGLIEQYALERLAA